MDRVILQKEQALVNIIKHVYKTMKNELLKYRLLEDSQLSVSMDGAQL